MGAWGAGIFDDDLAADVRDVWQEALDAGGSAADATRRVYEEFGELVEDEDERPVFFIALATLQLDAGALDDRVRDMALVSIPASVERWKGEAQPADAHERAEVLDGLRRRVESFARPS